MVNAILSAALEIIERDAFIIAWHNEFPCMRVNAVTHPVRDVVELCRAYERRGVEMQLYRLHFNTPSFISPAKFHNIPHRVSDGVYAHTWEFIMPCNYKCISFYNFQRGR